MKRGGTSPCAKGRGAPRAGGLGGGPVGEETSARGGRGRGGPGFLGVPGEPVTVKAEPFGMLRKFQRVAQRLRCIATFGNGRKIKNGQRYHTGSYGLERRIRNVSRTKKGDLFLGRPLSLVQRKFQ